MKNKIKKYYHTDKIINVIFKDKIKIDWNELNKKIQLNNQGYITS